MIQIKKNNGPKTDPCDTVADIGLITEIVINQLRVGQRDYFFRYFDNFIGDFHDGVLILLSLLIYIYIYIYINAAIQINTIIAKFKYQGNKF